MDTKRLKKINEFNAGCLFAMVAVVCGPLLILGTAMLTLSGLGALEQARSNASTQRVEAVILSSQVGDFDTRTGMNTVSSSGVTQYIAMIEFSYEHDGETITSDLFTPVGYPGTRKQAEAAVARYPVGSTVRAWLPDRPGTIAFLEKAWNPFVYVGVAVGLGCWSFCGALMIVAGGWRRVRLCWLGAVGVGAGVLATAGWAISHAALHLPASSRPGWLMVVAFAVAASSVLPLFAARQAARIARGLAALGPQSTDSDSS